MTSLVGAQGLGSSRHARWRTATLVVIAVLFAACGGDDGSEATPTTSSGSSASPTTSSDSSATATTSSDSSANPSTSAPRELVKLRWGIIPGGSQAYLPTVLQGTGLAEEYGFEIDVVEYTAPGQQYTLLRGDEADMVGGTVLDLVRQREAGLNIQAVHTFLRYAMPIVTTADSEIQDVEDLQGTRVGTPGAHILDFLIARAATSEAFGFDIGTDAQVSEAAPGLLNELLNRGELDATLNFNPLVFAPLQQGEYRQISSIPELMDAAGFDTDAFYLIWILGPGWIEKHSDSIPDLQAMIDEGNRVLQTDDSVWPELAAQAGIEDADALPDFIKSEREILDAPYEKSLFEPTRTLLEALVEAVGREEVGFDTISEDAFIFPSE